MILSFAQSNSFAYVLMAMAAICMLIFFVVVFTAMYLVIMRRDRQRGNKWAELARQLGLQLKPVTEKMLSDVDQMRNRLGGQAEVEVNTTAQVMFGSFANRPVEVWIRQMLSSRNRVYTSTRIHSKEYFTCCRAIVRGQDGLEFSIKSKNADGLFTRALKGKPDITLGFAPFDLNYTIDGNDPEKLFGLLGSKMNDGAAIAERFAASLTSDRTICASSSEVRIEHRGIVLNAAHISASLNAATELAALLEHGMSA